MKLEIIKIVCLTIIGVALLLGPCKIVFVEDTEFKVCTDACMSISQLQRAECLVSCNTTFGKPITGETE